MNHSLRQPVILVLGLCLALAACQPHSVPKPNTPPQASLKLTPQEGVGPLLVRADGSASTDSDGTIGSYAWDWGDGSPQDSGVSSSHTYGVRATPYTVMLTVTDNGGMTSTASAIVTSRFGTGVPTVNPLVAAFTVTPDQGNAPLSITVNAAGSSAGGGKITKYAWDWGDGSASSDGQMSSHVYSSPGPFTIKLKVTDDKSQTASATRSVTVGQAAAPSIVRLSPGNAAHKIRSDTKIVIDFSEPMDPDSTEKAFKSTSAGLKQGEVNFYWRRNYSTLEIIPKTPLAYGDGQKRLVQWSLQGAKGKVGNTMPVFNGSFFMYGLVKEAFEPSKLNSGFITERAAQGAATRLTTSTPVLFTGLDNDPSLNNVGQYRSYLSYSLACPLGSACAGATPLGTTDDREVLSAALSLHGISAVGDPLRKLATANPACGVGASGALRTANFMVRSAFYDRLDESDYSRTGGQDLLCHLDSVPRELKIDVTQAVKNDWNNRQGQQHQSQFVMLFAGTHPAREFNALQIAGPGSVAQPVLSVDFLIDQ